MRGQPRRTVRTRQESSNADSEPRRRNAGRSHRLAPPSPPDAGTRLRRLQDRGASSPSKLREFGCDEVVTGIGRTGVVGVIRGRLGDGPHHRPARRHGRAADQREHRQALRLARRPARCMPAAMTATPPCCSARRNISPRRAISPAPSRSSSSRPKKAAAAATAMVKDGMMERFGIEEVFGMHNMPGLPVGQFAIRPGPIMAATAEFTITRQGPRRPCRHAAPHDRPDRHRQPDRHALQTIASRSVDPVESVVVSVTKFHGGDAYNVIPETGRARRHGAHAEAGGARRWREQRMQAICDGIGRACGATVDDRLRSPTIRSPSTIRTKPIFAGDVARDDRRRRAGPPGDPAGDGRRGFLLHAGGAARRLHLHRQWRHAPTCTTRPTTSTTRSIPHGVSYWVKLAETALAA